MSFLDSAVVDKSDPQTVKIHEVLIRAYADKYEALAISGQIGILQADISVLPKMRHTWWSILEEVAHCQLMRPLMVVVLKDPTVGAYHDDIRGTLNTDTKTLVGPPIVEPGENPHSTERGRNPVVGDDALLWPLGHTIKIRFLDGEPALRERVEEAARQWLTCTNLNFDFGDHLDSEIRISFQKQGSWAYVGTNALKLPDPQPNVNFGTVNADSSQKEIQRVVLHEFGHVLGLLHEHGNPLSDLQWEKDKVYADYEKKYHWSRDRVDRVIFEIWPPGYFPVRKLFDPASIMTFPIAAEHLRSAKAITAHSELSHLDQQFAAAIYPMRSR